MADRSSFALLSTAIALPDDDDEAARELAAEQRTTPRAVRACRTCDGPADENCAECGAPLCVACEERCGPCDAALCDPCASRHVHSFYRAPEPDLGECDPPAACARRRPCAWPEHAVVLHY